MSRKDGALDDSCSAARDRARQLSEWAPEITRGAREYVTDHTEKGDELLCRAEYDDLVRAFRTVGEPAASDKHRNQHLRRIPFEAAIEFATEYDLYVVPRDDPNDPDLAVEWADVYALPTSEGIVPTLSVFAGETDVAAAKSHALSHLFDEYVVVDEENAVIADGGNIDGHDHGEDSDHSEEEHDASESHPEYGEPEPFGEDDDGNPLLWDCPNPDCQTQKQTKAKAAAHCLDEENTETATESKPPTETTLTPNKEPNEEPSEETEPHVVEPPTTDKTDRDDGPPPAFVDAIEWYHDHLDCEIPGEYDTAREYLEANRQWIPVTIDEKQLGYAPTDSAELVEYLYNNGYEKDEILATGLFHNWDSGPKAHFEGRIVFPYFDHSGETPVYAASRSLNDPDDYFADQKYTKAIKTKDYSEIDEPIYGRETIIPGEPLLITEGIADAITAHEAGYPCLSPVTKEFKKRHYPVLAELIVENDVPRVYVVNDNEPAPAAEKESTEPESITDALTIEQFGSGEIGAVATVSFLAEEGIDARIGELPRPGSEKVDLDDYLHEWADTLDPILASANPANQHPAFEPIDADQHQTLTAGERTNAREATRERRTTTDNLRRTGHDERTSALFDLSITDVTGLSWGYRGQNPLGHHGESENYTLLIKERGDMYDHKYGASYNALTYLLCEAGERRPSQPSGDVTDRELFIAWHYAKQEGLIPADDPIPHRAAVHVAREDCGFEDDLITVPWEPAPDGETSDRLPWTAFADALAAVQREYALDPGRDAPEQMPLAEARARGLKLGAITYDDLAYRRATDDRGAANPKLAIVDVSASGPGEDVYLGYRNRAGAAAVTDALDEAGIEHGRESFGTPTNTGNQHYATEHCAPPVYDPEDFEREQHWETLQGPRYQEWLDAGQPVMIEHDGAGSGKTTNAALAAAKRDRPHTVLFDKHAKAWEFRHDPATPDDYVPLKGGGQPEHECCMAADVNAAEDEIPVCPTHGHPREWPRMCPIYQRESDDPLRQVFEFLTAKCGSERAHEILHLCDPDEHPWHGEECAWREQFDAVEQAERVVGVHEYQLLKTAVDGRDVILDETPRLLDAEEHLSVEGLTRAANRLTDLAAIPGTPDGLREFAQFALAIRDAIVADESAAIEDLSPPDLTEYWETRREMVDPDDLPHDVDSEEIEYDEWREYQDGMSGQYREHERSYVEREIPAETLAQLKLAYNESLVRRIKTDEWNGEPFCMDSLIAAGAKAGLDETACQQAIAVPTTLTGCPWCGSRLETDNGAHCCGNADCDWHEEHNTITRRDGPKARATAWIDDSRGERPSEDTGLHVKLLPPASEYPEPLVLDATATPEKIAGIYGKSVGEVAVTGKHSVDLDGRLYALQVTGEGGGTAGQYHASTIEQSERAQERIQTVIDHVCDLHEQPLFGIQHRLISLFEWPTNATILKYGGARGLNKAECDAVCCIGAPHPNIEDLTREAELLAHGHPDLRVGGEEYSTRRDCENPPIYRKLIYEDENGDGRAIPTKTYSALVGMLFREARENELEQFIHRIRPLLVDDEEPMKHAYLLTNVPTDVPIDEVASFEDLADPLSTMLPAPEGALELLNSVREVHAGNGPDGFRAAQLIEERSDGTLSNKVSGWHRLAQLTGQDVSLRTVYNWINDLEAIGLLTPEEYEPCTGVSYTVDFDTLQSALQVITSNSGFKVSAVRRFCAKVRAANGSLEWLAWAREVFDLAGDRCGVDPPPDVVG